MIAHRLSTIRDADKIVVLKNGKLVEVGNHEQLMEQYPDGVYSEFVKKQSGEGGTDSPTKTAEAKEEVAELLKEKEEPDQQIQAMLKTADSQDAVF